MAPPELWLLRHGATEWALSGRHTGSTDLPLLAEGEAEARALAPLLSRQQFAAVYTSPLQRARQTCALAGLGGQAVIEADLREWDYGRYEGITTAEIRQTVPGWTVFTHPCPDGERLEQVQQRCEGLISTGGAPSRRQGGPVRPRPHPAQPGGLLAWAWGHRRRPTGVGHRKLLCAGQRAGAAGAVALERTCTAAVASGPMACQLELDGGTTQP